METISFLNPLSKGKKDEKNNIRPGIPEHLMKSLNASTTTKLVL